MMAMKKDMGMMKSGMCGCQHHKMFGWFVLLLGVLFLVRDFGIWNFWNIQWWSIAFILIGLGACCKCCGRMC